MSNNHICICTYLETKNCSSKIMSVKQSSNDNEITTLSTHPAQPTKDGQLGYSYFHCLTYDGWDLSLW